MIVLGVIADGRHWIGEQRGNLLVESGLCGPRTLLEKQPTRTDALRAQRVGEQQGGILIGIKPLFDVLHLPGSQTATLCQERGQPGRRDFVE